MLSAVSYLHENNVYHRDLKLDNIMLELEGMEIKELFLIDFGFSTKVQDPEKVSYDFCGTPNYMAPELVQKNYSDLAKVDIWALGVILYKMIVGKFPFLKHEFDLSLDDILPKKMSSELKDVFEKIFVREP